MADPRPSDDRAWFRSHVDPVLDAEPIADAWPQVAARVDAGQAAGLQAERNHQDDHHQTQAAVEIGHRQRDFSLAPVVEQQRAAEQVDQTNFPGHAARWFGRLVAAELELALPATEAAPVRDVNL